MASEFIPQNFNQYRALYERSIQNPEDFWGGFATESFNWRSKWTSVVKADLHQPSIQWFLNAKLNITENCLDRHLAEFGDQTAIIWEPNNPEEQALHISYKQLHREVCRVANMLSDCGVKKGNRVCIYMPMVPELAYSVLACARMGAIHSVVFAGFSAKSLSDRINDATCSIVLTADGGFRGDKITPLKVVVDEALKTSSTIKTVIVLKRTKESVTMLKGRDIWWHDAISSAGETFEPVEMDSEDTLFILYTSGSTGKPKGMVHTCGGYMVYANYTFRSVFQYQPGEVYWCTADIGWITGHTYILYGPLSAGATTIMFEGVPGYPDMGRFWQVVEKHRVNIFYTAPTAIRALEVCDPALVRRSDLSSLRILGTVGEPINEEAWEWYHREIGGERCPIVDTWWQTETGGIMISPLAGITNTKPSFATLPLPGVIPCLMDEHGEEIASIEAEGRLCIKQAWPGMARTINGDHQRFKETYYASYPGKYFTGDGARRDAKGNYRITGRVDDILIVSGHNLGTAEIENAINEHPMVNESAVVGYPHPIKGNSIYAFVTCSVPPENPEELKGEVMKLVNEQIGPIARPEKIQICTGLPKTRSGKIMRRILRKVASGETSEFGDISTLLNPECVEDIAKNRL